MSEFKHSPVLVWDLPVRLFHWILAICLVTQWFTAEFFENAMDIHFYLGYFTLGLIIFRIVWAIVGTRYAKFSNFLAGPKAIGNYLKSLTSPNYTPSIGHNPAGALFIILVFVLVSVQGVTGLFATDDIVHTGPYYHTVSDSIQKTLQWLHHQTFSFLWIFIALHIVVILWYKWGKKHDLISPMIHGKKSVPPSLGIPHSAILRAILVAVAVTIFMYLLVEVFPPIPEDEFYY